jgi:hypothetical protein
VYLLRVGTMRLLKKQLKAAELLQELTVETIPNHTSLSEM